MERGLKNAARVVVVCSKKYVERANAGHTGHLTREGLASALNEIAAVGVGMRVQERTVPVREVVHGACEFLGLDPLHVANEGRFAIVPLEHAGVALDVLLRLPASQQAARIGIITEKAAETVALESRIGGNRVLDMRSRERLPRICRSHRGIVEWAEWLKKRKP